MKTSFLDRSFHDGRKKDSWNVPKRGYSVYIVRFYLKSGLMQGARIGVPHNPSIEFNLKKYRDEVIEANKEDWFRPIYEVAETIYSAEQRRVIPIKWKKKLDRETGKPLVDCQLLKVTAEFVGTAS